MVFENQLKFPLDSLGLDFLIDEKVLADYPGLAVGLFEENAKWQPTVYCQSVV